MPVLSMTSGLFDIFSFSFGHARNRFFVCYLWRSDICFDFKFSFHTVNKNIQMQLSHTPNYGLVCFLIGFHLKRRIFFSKPLQCISHFFLIVFGLWFNSKGNNRLWKGDLFKNNWIIRICYRISCNGIFKAYNCDYFSCKCFFNFFPLVCVH
ncbi:MAG: hypothetical protein ACD_48C00265G0001 [uncultured bacterium]|nr:MAG: hypothetical protein ACD_48C00265G0001 [uncultured bacterium]